mmetsp:Transcript_12948/g.25042  ORF Transcript_12948/g.25042 Transcript_12948/m.25042 type:complete len:1027 (+) Transcript_12948:330-3410(+)
MAPMGCGPLCGPITSMLLLFQLSIHAAGGVTVPCRINRWVSDNIDSSYDGVEYEWVDCKDSSSEKIYLLGGDQKRLAEFSTGDDAELNLQPVSGSNARSAGVVGDSAESEVYEIADVLSHARSSDLARSASNDVRTVLIIRMQYNDHQSSCNEQCCLNGIYSNQNQGGVTGSIAGVYETSSYGKTTWPNTASARKVVSVTMGKNVVTDSCAYRSEGSVADSKLSQQFPQVKLSDYRHIEYIMPEEFGRSGNTDKCNGMAGVANVNCQHPNAAVRNGVCYSYIRTTLQMVRAHEFGHNLGLGHSGQYTDEYGDSSAVMGYSRPSWLVFNAAHRFQLGWLAANDVADASYVYTSALYNIAELNTGLAATNLPHAVRFSCPSCQAARFRGGHIFLSFRGDDGYDAALTATHRNKILVHQAETYYTGLFGGRTHLHEVLSEGDSWQMAGFSIYFCSKTANSAKVVVARIIPATLIALCNDASLLLPRPPPPPPAAGGGCSNTCGYAGDGDCDDGGAGSEYSFCTLGSDCTDCGNRGDSSVAVASPPSPAPPPPPPSPKPPSRWFNTAPPPSPAPPPSSIVSRCVDPNQQVVSERIVGGIAIDYRRQYQFLVALKISGTSMCGGVLISPTHVLTAAHCTYGKSASQIEVRVGAHMLNEAFEDRDSCALKRSVSKLTQHPSFDHNTLLNDIAILTLDSPVDYSPIEVYDPSTDQHSGGVLGLEETGVSLRVAGWGYHAASAADMSNTPFYTDVPVVHNDVCNLELNLNIADSMVCAGGVAGRDACQGDSGGPLFSVRDGNYQLVGLVSFGDGCGNEGVPGVYTRLSSFRSWICEETGSTAGCEQPPPCRYVLDMTNVLASGEWCNSDNARKNSKDTCHRHKAAYSYTLGKEVGQACVHLEGEGCKLQDAYYSCERAPTCGEVEGLTDLRSLNPPVWCSTFEDEQGCYTAKTVERIDYNSGVEIGIPCAWRPDVGCRQAPDEYRYECRVTGLVRNPPPPSPPPPPRSSPARRPCAPPKDAASPAPERVRLVRQ